MKEEANFGQMRNKLYLGFAQRERQLSLQGVLDAIFPNCNVEKRLPLPQPSAIDEIAIDRRNVWANWRSTSNVDRQPK